MSLVAPYEHRQYLAVWIFVLVAFVVAVEAAVWLLVASEKPEEAGACGLTVVAVTTILLLVTSMISRVITRVDAHGVAWSTGWGWPGGRIALAQIASVEPTELNWLERSSAGWHWTVWHGWLLNVAGARAVEIFKTDGGRVTLGTDDPQGLVQAIERFRTGGA